MSFSLPLAHPPSSGTSLTAGIVFPHQALHDGKLPLRNSQRLPDEVEALDLVRFVHGTCLVLLPAVVLDLFAFVLDFREAQRR